MIDRAHHMFRRLDYIAVLLAIGRGQGLKDAFESGTTIMVIRRKVSSTKEGTAIGSEERSERPSTLSTDRLNRCLITTVHIRTLVAIHLYRDVVIVDELRNLRILVRLAVHHMAPMAPDSPNIEQHRLVLALRFVEGISAPLVPLHRLMHRGTQVRGRGAR